MGCWDPCALRPQRTGKGWGVTPVGRLFFAALLGSGCQHRAAAEPSHWPCAGREVSLTGAEVALAAIFRVRVLPASASCTPCCCSCPSLVLQGRSRAQPLPWSQALIPRSPGKARKRWGRSQQVGGSLSGTFMALKCQDAQRRACTASTAKDSTPRQEFGHCWSRKC